MLFVQFTTLGVKYFISDETFIGVFAPVTDLITSFLL